MIQSIIVAALFIFSLFYVGRLIYRSFQAKSGCGSNCKCGIDLSELNASIKK